MAGLSLDRSSKPLIYPLINVNMPFADPESFVRGGGVQLLQRLFSVINLFYKGERWSYLLLDGSPYQYLD